MEESLKLVVDQEVVNSQEMGGKSANMQGAKKVSFTACHSGKLLLRRLKDVLKVDHLVTDASPSTTIFFFFTAEQHRELQEVIHDLDIWHKSAKLVKALTDAPNLKDCGAICDWIEPIIPNHFWFCCQQANDDVLARKDVLHHVVGEHEWSDGQYSNSPLVSSDTDKPLLGKGSKALEALTKVILDKRWLESLVFYIWFNLLENFNSKMLKYFRKRNAFEEFYFYFIAFCARVLLAALDHNMHSFRPQATTKNGHLIFKKQYSKRTKHGHPEPVRAEKTYDYIQFLMASILKARVDDKDCCKGYFSSIRSPKESGPNHWF
ncbi:unnamed protein product, partial [Porites lobata]